MVKEEEIKRFYEEFCNVMRRRGEVKLKNIANNLDISESKARRLMKELIKMGKVKRIGHSYFFA